MPFAQNPNRQKRPPLDTKNFNKSQTNNINNNISSKNGSNVNSRGFEPPTLKIQQQPTKNAANVENNNNNMMRKVSGVSTGPDSYKDNKVLIFFCVKVKKNSPMVKCH